MEKKPQLAAEVAAKYDCTITPCPVKMPDGEQFDLRTISLEKADELYAKDFPWLILKKVRKKSEDPKPMVNKLTNKK